MLQVEDIASQNASDPNDLACEGYYFSAKLRWEVDRFDLQHGQALFFPAVLLSSIWRTPHLAHGTYLA